MLVFFYECQHSYSEALIYLEKAASTIKSGRSKVQLNLATIYNHIGLIYYKSRNDQLAMVNLQTCLDIRLKFLQSTHPDVITTYNNIDQVNELKQNLAHSTERKDESSDSSLHSQKSTCATTDTFDNAHEHCNSDDHPIDLRIIKNLENY